MANPTSSLDEVSCGAPGYCSAIGGSQTLGVCPGFKCAVSHGLFVDQTAGSWAAAVNPNPDVAPSSVSCGSAGNCSAVGFYVDSSGISHPLLFSRRGGTWGTGVQPPLPANAAPSSPGALNSVSCASAGSCSAVGSYGDSSGNGQGLLLTETGGTWAPGVEATLPANAGSFSSLIFESVSCAAPGDCVAIGTYDDSSRNRHWLMLSENGGTWARAIEATLPANAGSAPDIFGGIPGSVSCPSAGNCSAAVSYPDSSGDEHPFLLNESRGKWAPAIEPTLPANAAPSSPGRVDSVSCASAGDCAAVGRYIDRSGRQEPLLLSESGGKWQKGVEATLPANARPDGDGELNSVSCAPGGYCSAVGSYQDNYGNDFGLLVDSPAVPSRLRVSPRTFALAGRLVNGRCVKQTANNRTQPSCTRPVKLSVRYQLNISARVTIKIKRVLPGRLNKRRCVAPTRNNRTHRHCTRLVPLPGSLTKNGTQGSNRYTFNGRIGGRSLPSGTYRLAATPAFGSTQTLTFRIVG